MDAWLRISLTMDPVINLVELSQHPGGVKVDVDVQPIAAHRLIPHLALSFAAIACRIVKVANLASGLLVLIMSAVAVGKDLDLVAVGVLDALDTTRLRHAGTVRQIDGPVVVVGDHRVDKTAVKGVIAHRAMRERRLLVVAE